jgi:pimeloyl-ACP methyl ester carboxylesterase
MTLLLRLLTTGCLLTALSGCTTTITQATFFPDGQLVAPAAVLQVPQGYSATSQLIDLEQLGKVRVVKLDNPKSQATLIYSAGNGGFVDSESSSKIAKSFAELTGADIILYDYPGRGGTTIPATIEAVVKFGPALMDQLRTKGLIEGGPLYAYGFSFGGSMAAAMARSGGFSGLIIEGSAADYQAIGSDFVPSIARPFIRIRMDKALQQFDYFGYARASNVPILLLSGAKDQVIRPLRMKQFAEQLTSNGVSVTLQMVPGGHGGALTSEEGGRALQAFMGTQ